MRYAKIRKMDVSNGEGIRVSLFVQGCDFRCKGCFNQDIWSFDGGQEWSDEVKDRFIGLASKKYISGITILGGEPLHPNNIETVAELIHDFKVKHPQKTVWVYTGFTYEHLLENHYYALVNIDVLVDGQFVNDLKDLTLRFRGSSNQRLISVQESLKEDEIILWNG